MGKQTVRIGPIDVFDADKGLHVFNATSYGHQGTEAQTLIRTSPSLSKERERTNLSTSVVLYRYHITDLEKFMQEAQNAGVTVLIGDKSYDPV